MADKLPKPKSKKSASSDAPASPEKATAKVTASAQPPAPNALTDKQTKDFAVKAVRLEKAYQETRERCTGEISSAQGLYRAHLKDFKKQGGNPDILTKFIALAKRDPEEVARETRQLNQLAKLMELPLFAHLGVMDDGRTTATAIEDDKGDPLARLEAEGYASGKAGKTMSECKFAEETPEHDAWLKGWKKALGENAGVKALPAGRAKANGKHGATGATAH
ncbi:MAG TPA: hypothetical protein VM659_28700 [Dongiaceae bacterium]|nr:hypothetical protein [Dongiaceae bacterium]